MTSAKKDFPKVRTWNQLLADPRVKASEIWTEDGQGVGKIDWWIPLAPGFNNDGCSCIHEWSKSDCISTLNRVVEGEPY